MTDRDVQREIEANERRAQAHEDDDVDEGGLPGALDDLLDPFDDEADDDDVTSQRRLNDADQRRDSQGSSR